MAFANEMRLQSDHRQNMNREKGPFRPTHNNVKTARIRQTMLLVDK